eukprot:GHVN01073714.1.p2 GENE.GHVN01073714.1~~GHVN01073714.1.p2  ORF type:complete len:858 (-),score=136.27 GHVN01073714.1:62-2635(-)
MGFLSQGQTIKWNKLTKQQLDYVKTHGIEQFLHLWKVNKDRIDLSLKWGDEVEYTLVEFDQARQRVALWSGADVILEELMVRENLRVHFDGTKASDWRPEMASHMVEALPDPPYKLNVKSLVVLEESMRLRRNKIQRILPEGVYVSSQTNFPTMGIGRFLAPHYKPDPEKSCSRSVFIPDQFINPHPRFSTLVNNVRRRRKAKVQILVPVFQDEHTMSSPMWNDSLDSTDRFEIEKQSQITHNPVRGQIYMDMFGFGMGMSCVQLTYGTTDVSTARYLYDQLAVLAPLWLSLTASTPFFRGLLSNNDTRWSALSQAVDCRTDEEMGFIPKSRYGGISLYLSDDPEFTKRKDELNDTNPPINMDAYNRLVEGGVDETLARHYGYLWLRDPLVIYDNRIEIDDTKHSDHFENIQSTNWNSVRFKPPPASEDGSTPAEIGWRVEFRTPESQMTDFENAACAAVASLITQCILAQRWDLYIPMSKNDENMTRQEMQEAATKAKFWFRKDVRQGTQDTEVVEMSLKEIFFGCSEHEFSGLVPLAMGSLNEGYSFGGMKSTGGDSRKIESTLKEYIDFIRMRVSGEVTTNATFFRQLVVSHQAYKRDSVISPPISHDLCYASSAIGLGDLDALKDKPFFNLVESLYGPYLHRAMGINAHSMNVGSSFRNALSFPSSLDSSDRLPRMAKINTSDATVDTPSDANCSDPSESPHSDSELLQIDLQPVGRAGDGNNGSDVDESGGGESHVSSMDNANIGRIVSNEDSSFFYHILMQEKRKGRTSAHGASRSPSSACGDLKSSIECSTACPTSSCDDQGTDVGEIGQLPQHNQLGFDGDEDLQYFRLVYGYDSTDRIRQQVPNTLNQ